MVTALVVVSVLMVSSWVFLGFVMRQQPEPCTLTHYVDMAQWRDSTDIVALLEEKQRADSFEALAEDRLRMLHRLNDIYLNRETAW